MAEPEKRIRKPSSPTKNRFARMTRSDILKLTPDEIQTLIEELRIHQVELELQVEELRRTQEELNLSRDRYQELYDRIPVGYLTINKEGMILEANTTAAKMLGSTRHFLQKSIMAKFVAHTQQSQDTYHLFLRNISRTENPQECNLEMQRGDGSRFQAHLTAVPDENSFLPGHLRLVISDFTEQQKITGALKESEAKANALIKYAPTGIYEIDYRGPRIITVNDAACSLSGYSREELLAMNPMDILEGESKQLFWERIKALLEGKKIDDKVDFKVRKKDGSILDVTLNIAFSKAKPYTALVIGHDITERKKMEKTLKESEDRLRLAQSGNNIGVWDWQVATGELRLSAEAERNLGLESGSVKSHKEWRKLVHPDDISKIEAIRDKAISNHQPFDLEYRVILSSNEIRWVNGKGKAYYNEKGEPIRVIGMNFDITERKKTEEALRQSKIDMAKANRQKTDILESISECFYALDKELRFTYVNRGAEQIWGISRADLIGRKIEEVFPGLINISLSKFHQVLKEQKPQFYELFSKVAQKWGDMRVYPTPDGLSVYFQDITDRKKAEGILAKVNDELEIRVKERTSELAEANKQLKQYARRITQAQEEERKRIAYELHDDTAQYLAILKLQLDSILHSGKIQDPEVVNKLQFLEKDAERAVNDVRRYSHELRPSVLEHMGLQAALEQIAEDINKLNHFRVEIEVEGEEPELSEEVKLGVFRIAQETINNVRKHASANKALINLTFGKKHLSMQIVDDGIGFNQQEAESRTGKKGNLGMMSMKERAVLIGASLKIDSTPGKGTIIRLEVPL